MKGISLHEPWATAIAFDLKTIETRGYRLHYRGSIAICAARTSLHANLIHSAEFAPHFKRVGITDEKQLSFGCIVAICRVSDVLPTEQLAGHIPAHEEIFGDYRPGRFGWILEGLQRLRTPIPYRGQQGIFDIRPGTFEGAKFV